MTYHRRLTAHTMRRPTTVEADSAPGGYFLYQFLTSNQLLSIIMTVTPALVSSAASDVATSQQKNNSMKKTKKQ